MTTKKESNKNTTEEGLNLQMMKTKLGELYCAVSPTALMASIAPPNSTIRIEVEKMFFFF